MMKRAVLTPYSSGSLKELSFLSLPLVISIFSSYFALFCDRLFLSHYSIPSMEACAVAAILISIFHKFSSHIALMIQSFVARYKGEGKDFLVGPFTWQMIWFACVSSVIIIPIGLGVAQVFFKQCEVRDQAYTYFSYLLYGNCLFALESVFTSFYSGIGRTRLIFWFQLLSHGLNIGLNALLIFGIADWIPALGIHGAALGTLLSKLIATSCFGIHFIATYRGSAYQVERMAYNWQLLKQGLATGIPRSLGGVLVIITWSMIVHLMIGHGGDYLLAVSVGASLFLPFFSEAISQGVVVVTSYLIGKQRIQLLVKVVRSAILLNAVGLTIAAVPLILFPSTFLSFFLGAETMDYAADMLIKVCRWVWWMYACNSLYFIVFGIAMAYKETLFYFQMNIFGLVIWTYIPIYYALQVRGVAPDVVWLMLAFQPLFPSLVLLTRLFHKYWKKPFTARLQI